MSVIVIRRAAIPDKPEWLRMRKLLWPDEDAGAMAEELDELLRDEDSPVFVAERPDGGLCGLLEAGTRRYADGCQTSPVGYIEGWYVDEDVRGAGIGAALVAEAEAWARDRGLHEMASDAAIDNEVSREAHLRLGYREAGQMIHFAKTL